VSTYAPQPEPKPLAETVPVITVDGKIKKIPKPKETKFNKTNGNVEWASWTWNPITGCLHGCNFCYARAITHSGVTSSNYPFAFEPAFYEYRLDAPKNTKVPVSENPADGRVFVGSMADVFGKWVPDEWIQRIFNACMTNPEWEYLFLTKWPNRYKMLESLPKAWFGASVIQQSDVNRVEREMKAFQTSGVKWISLEPMLEPITFSDLSWCDLVVIGAQTATNQPEGHVKEIAADFEWVWDVVRQCKEADVPYYLKPNLLEDPGMVLPKSNPRRRRE
jgi:protein gp37